MKKKRLSTSPSGVASLKSSNAAKSPSRGTISPDSGSLPLGPASKQEPINDARSGRRAGATGRGSAVEFDGKGVGGSGGGVFAVVGCSSAPTAAVLRLHERPRAL